MRAENLRDGESLREDSRDEQRKAVKTCVTSGEELRMAKIASGDEQDLKPRVIKVQLALLWRVGTKIVIKVSRAASDKSQIVND